MKAVFSPRNQRRADVARQALGYYTKGVGNAGGGLEISDLICDLMHLADFEKRDNETEDERLSGIETWNHALTHYVAECEPDDIEG